MYGMGLAVGVGVGVGIRCIWDGCRDQGMGSV